MIPVAVKNNTRKQKPYKIASIWAASFFGGPLAGGYLIRHNFLFLGENDKANLTTALTLILTLILTFLLLVLPETFIDNIPNYLLPTIYGLFAALIVNLYQKKQLSEHEKEGLPFESNWKVLGISILAALYWVLIILLYLIPFLDIFSENQAATIPSMEENWFSIDWFFPSQLKSFDWANPIWFYAMLAVPLIFILRWLIINQFNQKLPIALTKKDLKSDPITYLRFIPPVFFTISLLLILTSLARPQTTNEQVEQWSEGIDIVLNIDISESMQIMDFLPNRLEAAKEVARNFVAGRFQDRIGLVIFSGDALPSCPLTTDYGLLYELIEEIDFDKIESRGTAIGNAVTSGINFLRESESDSKVMILLSDGDNTAGNVDPITAANLANAYNIKMYVIAIGRDGKVPFGTDFFGRPRLVENTFDETTLREIAKIGNGKFYRVSDKEALVQVFDEIDALEKAEIKETKYKDTNDFYYVYLKWAAVFLLLWLLTKSTFVTNVLTD
ncbi:VWA domain-containing protein [Ekhidna sp.]